MRGRERKQKFRQLKSVSNSFLYQIRPSNTFIKTKENSRLCHQHEKVDSPEPACLPLMGVEAGLG